MSKCLLAEKANFLKDLKFCASLITWIRSMQSLHTAQGLWCCQYMYTSSSCLLRLTQTRGQSPLMWALQVTLKLVSFYTTSTADIIWKRLVIPAGEFAFYFEWSLCCIWEGKKRKGLHSTLRENFLVHIQNFTNYWPCICNNCSHFVWNVHIFGKKKKKKSQWLRLPWWLWVHDE